MREFETEWEGQQIKIYRTGEGATIVTPNFEASLMQLQILQLHQSGLADKEKATLLGITRQTIKNHSWEMRKRNGILKSSHNKDELIIKAQANELLNPYAIIGIASLANVENIDEIIQTQEKMPHRTRFMNIKAICLGLVNEMRIKLLDLGQG